MSNPADIEKALRTAFIAALPASVGKTAFENQPFDPKGQRKWFAFHFLPNKPDVASLGLGGQDEHSGIAQIDIHIPKGTGKGTLTPISRLCVPPLHLRKSFRMVPPP